MTVAARLLNKKSISFSSLDPIIWSTYFPSYCLSCSLFRSNCNSVSFVLFLFVEGVASGVAKFETAGLSLFDFWDPEISLFLFNLFSLSFSSAVSLVSVISCFSTAVHWPLILGSLWSSSIVPISSDWKFDWLLKQTKKNTIENLLRKTKNGRFFLRHPVSVPMYLTYSRSSSTPSKNLNRFQYTTRFFVAADPVGIFFSIFFCLLKWSNEICIVHLKINLSFR